MTRNVTLSKTGETCNPDQTKREKTNEKTQKQGEHGALRRSPALVTTGRGRTTRPARRRPSSLATQALTTATKRTASARAMPRPGEGILESESRLGSVRLNATEGARRISCEHQTIPRRILDFQALYSPVYSCRRRIALTCPGSCPSGGKGGEGNELMKSPLPILSRVVSASIEYWQLQLSKSVAPYSP